MVCRMRVIDIIIEIKLLYSYWTEWDIFDLLKGEHGFMYMF